MIKQIAEVLGVLPFELIAYERQELRIKSLSDIFYILNELNHKTGIRFEIETKRPSKDGEWSCALKFDGNDPDNPYNVEMCQFLEQQRLEAQKRLPLRTATNQRDDTGSSRYYINFPGRKEV